MATSLPPFWASLPNEILLQIGHNLFLEDIANLALTCKALHTRFDRILYLEDAKPYHRHALYWGALNVNVAVINKALAAGSPVNDGSHARPFIRAGSLDSDQLQVLSWPELRSKSPDWYHPVPDRGGEPVNPGLLEAVTVLLEAGADMTILNDLEQADPDRCLEVMRSFLATPLGTALAVADWSFFDVVREARGDIVKRDGCSALTRAKLAIAERNVDRLTEVLESQELSLDEHLGEDLIARAHRQHHQGMCRLLYRHVYGKEAPDDYLRDDSGQMQSFELCCAQRILQSGASGRDVTTESWRAFQGLPRVSLAIQNLKYAEDEGVTGDFPFGLQSLVAVAMQLRDVALLELALSCCPSEDSEEPHEKQMLVLQYAIDWADYGWVEYTLDQGYTFPAGAKLAHPLREAATQSRVEIVRLLLQRGALSWEGTADDGSLVADTLMCCEEPHKGVDVLSALLEGGANAQGVVSKLAEGYPEDTRSDPQTCVKMVCQRGCLELLEQHGIMIYRPHNEYLHHAVEADNLALATRLLEDGLFRDDFAPWPKGSGMLAPCMVLDRSRVKETVVCSARSLSMVKLLVAHGAGVDDADDDEHYGPQAFWYPSSDHMADRRDEAVAWVRLLLENGADTKRNAIHYSLAATAERQPSLDMQRLLLDAGADPRYSHSPRQHPNVFCTLCNSPAAANRKVVRLLLERDPSLAEDEALMKEATNWACTKGNVGVLRMLMEFVHVSLDEVKSYVANSSLFFGRVPRVLAFAEAQEGTVRQELCVRLARTGTE